MTSPEERTRRARMATTRLNQDVLPRVQRHHRIVEELRAGGKTSARQLATTLGVGLRTIERDVAELVRAGLPIITERGCHGGYRLAAVAAPKPVSFTVAEAAAIAVALTSVGPYSSACNQAALDKVLDAIRSPGWP